MDENMLSKTMPQPNEFGVRKGSQPLKRPATTISADNTR
jgi:hypothetical protein